MSTGLRVLTWGLFALPALFLYFSWRAPPPVNGVFLGSTVLIAVVYASVGLVGRPTRFEIDADTLRIVWPLRVRVIDRVAVEGARIVTASEFRRDYGYGIRIGAGGLWGSFGLLNMGRETFSMWISRTDRFVIVTLRDARPLLITPDQPERFVESLTARTGPRSV